MQRKVTLTLSPIKRTEKPTDGMADHFQINEKNIKTLTLEELANKLMEGHLFSHGVFAEERKAENFLGTDMVVLDIDNKDTKNPLTIGDALERLKGYGLDCNLIYTTLSDSLPKGETRFDILRTASKYRIIFELPEAIYNIEELDRLLWDCLYQIFPEADRTSGVQFWYGGKNIAYANYDYILDVEVLYSCLSVKKTSHLKAGKRKNEKLKEFAASPSNLMGSTNGSIDVPKTADAFNKYKGLAEKRTFQPIRDFDWVWACSQCDLLDSFLNCKKKIYHNELHYLYLAMSKIEGGAKKWKEAVKNNPEIDNEKLADIAYYLERRMEMTGYQIFEARISKYAPDDKAAKKYDFLTNVSNKLNGKIEVVDEEKNYFMPLNHASSALNYYFKEFKSELGSGNYVFKCATGLGKTEEIIRCNNLAECVIAFPTHDLKDEVSIRLKRLGIEHHVIPELPDLPKSIRHEYNNFLKIGAFDEAASLLWQIASGENITRFPVPAQEFQDLREALTLYFNAIEECKESTFPVLTTHKKLLNAEFPNHSTYIIDEDIIPSLFEVNQTSSKDLRMLISKLKEEDYPGSSEDIQKLTEFYEALDKDFFGKVTHSNTLKVKFSADSLKRFVKIAIKNGLPIEGSLIGLFTCDFFFVDDLDEKNDSGREKAIRYLKKNTLPDDKKIIVLSATADIEIYELIFKNMVWNELSQVEQVGNMIQVFDNSFSRARMNNSENKEKLEYLRDFAGETPVITFKSQKNRFNNPADFCLESSEGFDALKGQDIVVVGTPHLKNAVYALLATAMGIQFTSEDLKLEMIKCEHNNLRFDFYTFKHIGLRKVQYSKIESQLIQACGRARAIREHVNVFLFSSFALPGFQKMTLAEFQDQNQSSHPDPGEGNSPVLASSNVMPSGSQSSVNSVKTA